MHRIIKSFLFNKTIVFLSIFVLFSSLYSYKAFTSYRAPAIYNWDSDFGRDLYFMQKIGRGDFVLVGPQLSFAGLRLAAYHFYLFAPILKIFNSWKAVIIANALLFSFTLTLIYFLLTKRTKSYFYSLLGILWVGLSPYIIFSARSPGNATSYLPFLSLYIFLLYFTFFRKFLPNVAIGFLAGVIVNFHPAAFPVVFFTFIANLISKKQFFKKAIAWITGFSLSFIPLLIFEIRHNFVILKGLFAGKSSDYIGNLGLLGGIKFLNGKLISSILIKRSFEFLPGGILLIFPLLLLFLKNKKAKVFPFASLLSWILFLLFGRGVYHYFFPYFLLSQLIIIFDLIPPKNNIQKLIVIGLLLINLANFPSKYYKPARSLATIEPSFKSFLSQTKLPQPLNVLLINNNPLSSVGWEYRYLLEKNNVAVMKEYEYQQSKYLLVASEIGPIDLNKINKYEFSSWKDNRKFKSKVFTKRKFWYYLLEKL